jgi:two-component system, response regulator RegA
METILLVDDEQFFLDRMDRAFIRRGYTTHTASCYAEGLEIISAHKPSMAVVDLKMPGKSGLQLLKDGLKILPQLRVVVLTGYGSIATATEAIKMGAVAYLAKPADVDEIIKSFDDEGSLNQEDLQEDLSPPSLARVEWEHIQRVLSDCDDNISTAAKKLGIHRRTLQRKLYKYAPK